VSRELFERKHAPVWTELDGLLRALEAKRPEAAARLARLPSLYRQVCHHLALARYRQYGGELERRLDALALAGHQALYARRGLLHGDESPGFFQLVRAEARLLGLAVLLLFAPAVLTAVAVLLHPDLAVAVLPAKTLDQMARQFAPDGSLKAGRPVDDDVLMFGFYIYNNIGVAFRTYAGGVLFGLGTVAYLVINGILMGALAGEVHALGYEERFYSFVIGHGAFELTAIVLAATAGLALGRSVLAPGRLTRGRSLILAARRSVRLLSGAAVMLVAAAALEAFWSSANAVPPGVKLGAGAVLWAAVAAGLALGGRRGN
jgi:uncharacterized membrane protein SpoIIM required for sporulation